MKIQTTGTYRGLDINDTSKGFKGYYIQHLQSIHSLLVEASLNLVNPLVSHFIIDKPKPRAINALNQELNRWRDQRLTSSEKVRYFAVLEKRPKEKRGHIHVLVIYPKPTTDDKFLSTSLNLLTERLRKLSETNSATLCKRKSSAKKLIIDPETGEIKINTDGSIIRLGSSYYHNLITEFDDAFKRLSYFAKVHTKDQEQIRGLYYSSSIIPRPKTINNTKKSSTNETNTRVTNLLEQNTSLQIHYQDKNFAKQEHTASSESFWFSRSIKADGRYSEHTTTLKQLNQAKCEFGKSNKDSKDYILFSKSVGASGSRTQYNPSRGRRSPFVALKQLNGCYPSLKRV